MFKKFFNKENIKKDSDQNTLITALLIHAAKIDDNYTDFEKEIIKKALIDLNLVKIDETEKLLKIAEEKEKQSNQIIEFTKEIKKKTLGI